MTRSEVYLVKIGRWEDGKWTGSISFGGDVRALKERTIFDGRPTRAELVAELLDGVLINVEADGPE